MSACAIAATNIDVVTGFGAAAREDSGARPPSGAPTVGQRGRWPLLAEPGKAEGQVQQSRWSTVFGASSSPLVDLDDFAVEDLARRICDACDTPLPIGMDECDAHVLAVVGLNAVGKTHYLATALSQSCRESGLEDAGFTDFHPDDEDTSIRLHSKYYVPVFREGSVLSGTQVDAAVREKPLTFRVQRDGGQPFLVMTHDISGEVLSDRKRRASQTPFLRRASAVLFLVDPLEFNKVRSRVGAPPVERAMDQADLLHACLTELQYAPGGRPPPVAVVITKSDLLRGAVSPAAPFFRSPDTSSVDAYLEDIRRNSDAVAHLLEEIGERRLVTTARKHGPVTFHMVSALGHDPAGGSLQRVEPLRCLDPLATVLQRLDRALTR